MRRLTYRNWVPDHASTFAFWHYRNPDPAEPHDHDHHELFWVTRGAGIHWVDGAPRPIAVGTLLLIRPSDSHSFSTAPGSPGVEFFNFAFRSSFWHALRRRQPLVAGRFFDLPDIARREFQLGPASLERLRVLAADLASGAYDGLTTESFLTGVVSVLAHLPREGATPVGTPRWLAEAIHQFRRYPEFTGGVPRLIRLAGRSHEHTARACRRHLSCSPRDLVQDARLHWATAQIASTEKKILEIALECGFENLGHFYQCFRRRHGMPPHAYRTRFQPRHTHLA